VGPEDAEQVEAVLRGARRRGQLSALAADRWRVLHRLPKVLGVLDPGHGRYVTQRATGPDGAAWTTLAPTDHRRLHGQLSGVLLDAETAAARV
jgi:hypothetical protein